MDRAKWQEWRDTPEGPRKRRLFGQLVADNESLAQRIADGFLERSKYSLDGLRDDILQASLLGIMLGIQKWDPAKGAFSTCAFRWALHEMQQVAKHAMPVTIPKEAYLPKAKQDAAAAFAARTGRDPEPAEIGVTPAATVRAQAAMARFGACKLLIGDAPTEDDLIDAIDGGSSREVVLAFLESRTDDQLEAAWDLTAQELVYAAVAWRKEACLSG
jgi:DNA-directed RNA polymerase specialized sigma subunit